MNYVFTFRVPMKKFAWEVKPIEESLNESLDELGFDEKITIMSSLPVEMTTSRELTAEELEKACRYLKEKLEQELGSAELESIGKKP